MKLQDAYVAEKGIQVGTWKQIGYLMNNSSNYNYCGNSTTACEAATNSDGYGAANTDGKYKAQWVASNVATLNDCAAKSAWALETSQNGSAGGLVLYAATVTGNEGGSCEVLTPNYLRLNTKKNSN